MEYHGANTNLFSDRLKLLLVGMLFLCDFLNSRDSLCEEILQENNVTRSGSKFCTIHTNRTVGNVNKLIVPIVSHKLNNLKPLCKVERLLCRGYVYSLVKFILALAVYRSSDVTGRIKG